MYGLGYGLGKMVEGATGGLLAKKRYDEANAAAAAEAAERSAYRNRQLDIQERTAASQEELARVSKSTSALRTALDALEKTGDPEFFKKIYGSLYPEGEIPDVKIQGPDTEIILPGLKIKGKSEPMKQAMEIIAKNPDKVQEVIGKLAELGLAKIEVTEGKEEKDKPITVAPGHQVIDPKTGKVIYTAPEKAEKLTASDQQAKVSNYATFITNTLAKYKMKPKFDIAAIRSEDPLVAAKAVSDFMSSESGAYQALREKVKAGDEEAIQDLKDLQESYGKMKSLLGIGQPAAAPATPGTLGGMVSGPTGPAAGLENMPFQPGVNYGSMANMPSSAGKDAEMTTLPNKGAKKKAVFDPKTGRFIYK